MKVVLHITLIIMMSAAALSAAEDGGTQSPFSFGVGSRQLALGGAALSDADPAVSAYWNVSALATTQYITVAGFHSRLLQKDVAYQYLGIAMPTLDFGTIGLGIFRLAVDGIERRDDGNLLLGQFDDSRLAVYLGYARHIAGYDLGMGMSIEHHAIDSYRSTSSPGVNLSVGRKFSTGLAWVPNIQAAVIGRNVVAPSMKLADAGVSYPRETDLSIGTMFVPSSSLGLSLSAYGRVSKSGSHDLVSAVGAEANLGDFLMLRNGVRDGDMSFGAGLRYRLLSFDYAVVARDLGNVHTFDMTLSFGAPLDRRRQIREQAREDRFRNMMNEHIVTSNGKLVTDLVNEGLACADIGNYERATAALDRALFLARTSALDTTEASRYFFDVSLKLRQQQEDEEFSDYLESAKQHLANDDFIAAKYSAAQALKLHPDDPEATAVFSQSEEALKEDILREQMISEKLRRADSLLTYNDISGGLSEVRGLSDVAGNDVRVSQALQKAEFAYWREKASRELAAGNFSRAEQALDSAEVRFPGHPLCESMRRTVAKANAALVPVAITERDSLPKMSQDMQQKAAEEYQAGKRSFERGQLREAIAYWERVELLAPGYQSVREHLVNAYKFAGVEQYGNSKLEDAATTWKKALRLSPGNAEIAGYVRRVESEMSRLQELGYDQ